MHKSVGVLSDRWYLHREAILRIAGVVMLIVAAAVVIAGAGASPAILLRNLAAPVIGVATVAYLVRRWYWYDEGARWDRLSPESIAIAGALSVVLAVIAGAPASGSPDRASIESAITRAFTTSDPANCAEVYTQKLMDQTHIGNGAVAEADCREDEADPDTSSEADSVSISTLALHEATATATVSVVGGALDRSVITVRLVTDQGEWKLDEMLDVDLDRAAFDAAMAARGREEGLSAEEADCAVAQFHREVRMAELERAAVTGVEPSGPDWGIGCFTTPTLRSMLIEKSREAAEGLPATAVDCLADRLGDLPASRLRAMFDDANQASTEALMRSIMERCLASTQSASPS